MLRVDMDIVAYAMNIDGRNGRGVERYNLESVLNIAADLLHIKSLNAQSGWPGNVFHYYLLTYLFTYLLTCLLTLSVRLKQVKASNGKVLKSLVVNTKRISFQISFVILYIIRMYQLQPQVIKVTLFHLLPPPIYAFTYSPTITANTITSLCR